MPKYKIKPDSNIVSAIRDEAIRRCDKLARFTAVPFPLNTDRVEELLNTPEIIHAVRKLQSLDFAAFAKHSTQHLMFDNIGCDRECFGLFTFTRDIIVAKPSTYLYSMPSIAEAKKAYRRLDSRRMTDQEKDAVRVWADIAVKSERQKVLVIKTIECFFRNCDDSYQLMATWHGITNIVDYKKCGPLRPWGLRFDGRPRNLADHVLRHIPEHLAMPKRMEAVDLLMLKSEICPNKEPPRAGKGEKLIAANILGYAKKPNDPVWMWA